MRRIVRAACALAGIAAASSVVAQTAATEPVATYGSNTRQPDGPPDCDELAVATTTGFGCARSCDETSDCDEGEECIQQDGLTSASESEKIRFCAAVVDPDAEEVDAPQPVLAAAEGDETFTSDVVFQSDATLLSEQLDTEPTPASDLVEYIQFLAAVSAQSVETDSHPLEETAPPPSEYALEFLRNEPGAVAHE